MKSKKITYWLLASILISLTSFAEEKTKEANQNEQSESIDFIRFNETDFNASLETASAKYINDDGVEVELIGVVHIVIKNTIRILTRNLRFTTLYSMKWSVVILTNL